MNEMSVKQPPILFPFVRTKPDAEILERQLDVKNAVRSRSFSEGKPMLPSRRNSTGFLRLNIPRDFKVDCDGVGSGVGSSACASKPPDDVVFGGKDGGGDGSGSDGAVRAKNRRGSLTPMRSSYLKKIEEVNHSQQRFNSWQKRAAWSLLSMHYDIRLSDGRAPGANIGALSHVSVRLMNHYNLLRGSSNKPGPVPDDFMCDASTYRRWVTTVAGAYRSSNPYHSEVHAADVVQTVNSYLDSTGVLELPAPLVDWRLSRFILLVAAAVHDVAHPARMNPFMVTTKDPLTLSYANEGIVGVLEAMHSNRFTEISRLPGHDIFELVPPESQTKAKEAVLALVLATDLTKQKDILGRWNAKRVNLEAESLSAASAEETPEGGVEGWKLDVANNEEDRVLLFKMLLKAADVSNPAKDLRLYLHWTERIQQEFYEQVGHIFATASKLDFPIV